MSDLRTNDIADAIMIAAVAHKGQVDKLGEPYILHCIAVMMYPQLTKEEEKIVAVLHDVFEDCPESWKTVVYLNFDFRIYQALEAITHKENEPNKDYYARVRANPLALAVKKCDVAHNISRLYKIQDMQEWARLTEKYKQANKELSRYDFF